MNAQQAAVARLTASRGRLRGVLIAEPGSGASPSLLGSLVGDHPLAAAALAALVGGLTVRLRPWRWLLRSGLWVALLPQVVSMLSKAPLASWAESLMALLRRAEPEDPAAGPGPESARDPASDPASESAPAPAPAAASVPAAQAAARSAVDPMAAPAAAPTTPTTPAAPRPASRPLDPATPLPAQP